MSSWIFCCLARVDAALKTTTTSKMGQKGDKQINWAPTAFQTADISFHKLHHSAAVTQVYDVAIKPLVHLQHHGARWKDLQWPNVSVIIHFNDGSHGSMACSPSTPLRWLFPPPSSCAWWSLTDRNVVRSISRPAAIWWKGFPQRRGGVKTCGCSVVK